MAKGVHPQNRRGRGSAAIGLIAALLLAAEPAPGAPPEPVPAAAAAQIDVYLRSRMAALQIPGMQVAVVREGRIVFLRSYGLASVELGVPMTDRTILSVNSIAKAYSGIAAMRLVEAGRLDLSAPISTYLSNLPEAWKAVTVRQLLSHMSGLPDVTRAPTVETDEAAAWAWVAAQPVLFPPGQRFHYCQTNYTLLLHIVNRMLEREPNHPLAADQIEIAGLTRTAYGDSTEVVAGRGPSYRFDRRGGGAPVLRPAIERFLPFRRASSGLNATAEDLARWIIALQSGAIVSRAALETAWTPVRFTDGRPGQWGLGWQVLRRSTHRAVGMTGGGRAAFYIYPEHDVAVVILTNLAGAFPEDMVDLVAARFAPDLRLTGVPALRARLEERGFEQAEAVAAELARAEPGVRWEEAELNDWGYRLLSSGRPQDALQILRLTAGLHPESGNAQDSLGEALLANGDRRGAISAYERAASLDPGNAHARETLERLRVGPD